MRAYRKELADIDPKLTTPEPEDQPLLERVQDQDLSAADKTVAPDARQSLRDKYAGLLDKALGAAEGPPEHAEVTAILASICRVVEWEGLGAPTEKSYAECRAKFRELDDDDSGELEEEEIGRLAHVRPPPPLADDLLSLAWVAHTAGFLRPGVGDGADGLGVDDRDGEHGCGQLWCR